MTHRLAIRIYYEDTDLAGIVYYANYLRFFERGRTEALRSVGIDQRRLQADQGLVFVVARVEIDYRRPALFDDLIEVATTLTRRGHASVEVMQAVTRDGDPLAQGVVRLGVMGRDGRPARLPDAVAVALDRLQRA